MKNKADGIISNFPSKNYNWIKEGSLKCFVAVADSPVVAPLLMRIIFQARSRRLSVHCRLSNSYYIRRSRYWEILLWFWGYYTLLSKHASDVLPLSFRFITLFRKHCLRNRIRSPELDGMERGIIAAELDSRTVFTMETKWGRLVDGLVVKRRAL